MKVIERVTPELWNDIAEQCHHTTFFHTHAWAKVVLKTLPRSYRIATKAFEFGPDEWAVLPLVECDISFRGIFKTYYSNMPDVYGGLISNTAISPDKAARIAEHLASTRALRIEIFGNPYDPAQPLFPGWRGEERFTQVRRLDGFSTEEELLRSYGHCIRNHIRKAAGLGYTMRRADRPSDVEAYYGLYLAALERWGDSATSRYGVELFDEIVSDRSGRMEVWLCHRGGALAGGVVSFRQNDQWTAWHSAFREEEYANGVAKYLHHRLIMHAKAQGYRYYDFNPSGGHEGTVRFKEMFGAEKRAFAGGVWENGGVPKVVESMKSLAMRCLF